MRGSPPAIYNRPPTRAGRFQAARRNYHKALSERGTLCTLKRGEPKEGFPDEFPSNANGDSSTSIAIAQNILDHIQSKARFRSWSTDQSRDDNFVQITRSFLEEALMGLGNIRPNNFKFIEGKDIFRFEQYCYFAKLSKLAERDPEISYLLSCNNAITPDILVIQESEHNNFTHDLPIDTTVDWGTRKLNTKLLTLQASISCKWSFRRDAMRNARSEGLNLVGKWKERAPLHIAVVTGEPLPSSLATLALGTGDIDCVYHIALPELIKSIKRLALEDSMYLIRSMMNSRRLKDIADLPLDLATNSIN